MKQDRVCSQNFLSAPDRAEHAGPRSSAGWRGRSDSAAAASDSRWPAERRVLRPCQTLEQQEYAARSVREPLKSHEKRSAIAARSCGKRTRNHAERAPAVSPRDTRHRELKAKGSRLADAPSRPLGSDSAQHGVLQN